MSSNSAEQKDDGMKKKPGKKTKGKVVPPWRVGFNGSQSRVPLDLVSLDLYPYDPVRAHPVP